MILVPFSCRSHSTPLRIHSYAVSYAGSTRSRLFRLTPTNPQVAKSEVIAHPDDSKPTTPTEFHSQMTYIDSGSPCFDPMFPTVTSLPNDYPMSYEISALDVESGWVVVTSSSLSRLPGSQVMRIKFQHIASSPATLNSANSANLDDLLRMEPSLYHVTWLRHHSKCFVYCRDHKSEVYRCMHKSNQESEDTAHGSKYVRANGHGACYNHAPYGRNRSFPFD